MIKLFSVNIPKTVDKPLLEVLHSGYVTQGPKVEEFEALLRDYFDSHPVTVNSGTSALTLALRLANVTAGDEVITTPMTCSATNLPILSFGAVPVFADVYAYTGLINPNSVEKLITPKTKAIMAVDWGGSPVDDENLMDIAHKHGLKLIIDSAHSFGALHTRKPIADFVCFSLQAIKHITTIDGGVVLCKTENDYQRAKRLRWFGISRDNTALDSRITEDIVEWGYKFHMNDVNAVIGIEQMNQLPHILDIHRMIANFYDENIRPCYRKPPKGEGAFWLYTLLLPKPELRDKFKQFMADRGIMVSEVHRRNDEYTVFKPFVTDKLPGADYFSSRMVCIPVNASLSPSDMRQVAEACNEFAEVHGL